jgi:1,4-dihydroxy-6-naphthoate synthase
MRDPQTLNFLPKVSLAKTGVLIAMDIHVAHSPDSDDAFMFYALATHKIDTGDRNYIHLLNDIETLNRKALEGEYEVSAISFHAYAYMADKYALLSCGASMGNNYGPIVVSSKPMSPESLGGKVVAVPGCSRRPSSLFVSSLPM